MTKERSYLVGGGLEWICESEFYEDEVGGRVIEKLRNCSLLYNSGIVFSITYWYIYLYSILVPVVLLYWYLVPGTVPGTWYMCVPGTV